MSLFGNASKKDLDKHKRWVETQLSNTAHNRRILRNKLDKQGAMILDLQNKVENYKEVCNHDRKKGKQVGNLRVLSKMQRNAENRH